MKRISVDEARSRCGFGSLTGSDVASKAFNAILKSTDSTKNLDNTSTSLELKRYKLQKYSVKEARDILEDEGFRVNVTPEKGIIKIDISWFFPVDKENNLIF